MTPPPSGVGTFLNLGLYWNGLTPPLKSTWDFFELGIFLKRYDPLKILRNKSNMKNVGTKSISMSDIMVYFTMFSLTNDKISSFMLRTWSQVFLITIGLKVHVNGWSCFKLPMNASKVSKIARNCAQFNLRLFMGSYLIYSSGVQHFKFKLDSGNVPQGLI